MRGQERAKGQIWKLLLVRRHQYAFVGAVIGGFILTAGIARQSEDTVLLVHLAVIHLKAAQREEQVFREPEKSCFMMVFGREIYGLAEKLTLEPALHNDCSQLQQLL